MPIYAIVTYKGARRSRRLLQFGRYFWAGRPETVTDPEQIAIFQRDPIYEVRIKGIADKIQMQQAAVQEEVITPTKEDLELMPWPDLVALAKSKGIGTTGKKRADMVTLIMEAST